MEWIRQSWLPLIPLLGAIVPDLHWPVIWVRQTLSKTIDAALFLARHLLSFSFVVPASSASRASLTRSMSCSRLDRVNGR
jgi:hypothetical protein